MRNVFCVGLVIGAVVSLRRWSVGQDVMQAIKLWPDTPPGRMGLKVKSVTRRTKRATRSMEEASFDWGCFLRRH